MNTYGVSPFCADVGSFAKFTPGDRLREDGKVRGVWPMAGVIKLLTSGGSYALYMAAARFTMAGFRVSLAVRP